MPAHRLARLIALYLLIQGIWGLFSTMVFGVFTTNTTHAVIELIFAVAGFSAAMMGMSAMYLVLVGAVLVIVGALHYALGPTGMVDRLLNVNDPLAIVNVIVGLLCIAIGAMNKATIRPTESDVPAR